MPKPNSQRLAYLDGHRGLAILAVIAFHAYARWPALVPYGDQYKSAFNLGWLGVQLFFLISGFVILMTLEKCTGVREFLFKRWLRLLPAMLLCSLIIWATGAWFPERPSGPVTLAGMLPGLLFIEPSWFKHALGLQIVPLEGVFWSLYAEFKFYVISALLYFWIGRTRLIGVLFALSAFAFIAQALAHYFPTPVTIGLVRLAGTMSFEHFGWFASGAAAYCFMKTNDRRWLGCALALTAYSAIFVRFGDAVAVLAALVVGIFFLGSLLSGRLQAFLGHRVFLFFGLISYPLYLLHENIMVAVIVKIGRLNWPIPAFAYPLLPFAALCVVSFLIAKYAEPMTRQVIARAVAAPRDRFSRQG